ncbi:MAG: hypothetical protein KME15_10130 [Drouetiella hepatica Uher 2000/2452]|jgi:hypothetical protein|uniref:Uncharacterized protein n=1 Tax=Drouetiella hepatica Uher 2000/2452 TaxID=904376 RepID=A0A951Q947_9CYAN|nr:hypothetical protein [Drouetiella hepatica Uher 2000/2452]
MSDSLPSIPQYRVSIWEGMAIAASAVLLVAVGLAGLSVKALNNAFNPNRAEAIARSMVDYKMPNGSKGLFGTNVGGGRMAVISSTALLSTASPGGAVILPEVELAIARIPAQTGTDVEEDFGNEFLFSGFSFSNQTTNTFQITKTQTELRSFCGTIAQVKVDEGTLTLADQTPPVLAVRYQTQVMLDQDNRIAIVSAVGQNATVNAAIVFDSIKCKP